MLNKRDIFEREQKKLKRILKEKFTNIPDLPEWVSEELIYFWNENMFHVHYLPEISLDEILNLLFWKDKPNKIFYRKIREGKLKREVKTLPGKWLLIDGRDKPAKKVPWIQINDVWILQKIGFDAKNYFKKWDRQLHDLEYLRGALKEKGFASRFCLTIYEINDLKSFALNFLKINQQKIIRLPFFAEYNYLGNVIYKQWRTTKTWEWLEDKLDDGRHLASGSRSVGCLGFDSPDFWSTILTFRFVVEL